VTTAADVAAAPRPPLGLDLYSLRSQGWTAFEAMDFCRDEGVEVAHFSMPSFLGSLEPANLAAIRAYAQERDLTLEVGMGSICESSTSFARDDGPAVDQLGRMLEAAHAVGSSLVRCFLGSSEDREGSGAGTPLAPQSTTPLLRHIRATVAVCRAVADRARSLGVRVAIENHVGDLHSTELRMLVEEAGSDFVGALLDTGNAAWALETPVSALETLGPSVIATHVRDSAVWEVPDGIAVQWCPLGRGNVGIDSLADRLGDLAPAAAFTLEIINRPKPRIFAWRQPGFWRAYETIPASGFGLLLEAARSGTPYPGPRPGNRSTAEIELDDVRDGLRYAREILGLGRPAAHA
jgi:sugar phosphate isomerase/epimerase